MSMFFRCANRSFRQCGPRDRGKRLGSRLVNVEQDFQTTLFYDLIETEQKKLVIIFILFDL